jgi:2,3-bisphosphoglycerate-dependent phosphoglycerate mutase
LYTLVLLRHGESEWNSKNLYTGWCDVNLTKNGEIEARTAGRILKENDIHVDHAFTSVLKRAIFTTNMALNTAGQHWVPVTKSWRLNERHYGALQGYNKDTAYQELGIDQELVMEMRRSYDTRPPRMEDDHPYWHGKDRRYKELSLDQLDKSRAESLKDTADRILPFFHSQILPSIRAGNKCLIVSHANTLRTLIKHIDNISDQDIKGMSIPTGIPLLYRLDYNLRPVDPEQELEFKYMAEPKGYTWGTSRAYGFHGVYLGDLTRLQEIQRKRDATNRDWQRIILRNLFKSLDEEEQQDGVVETRALYFQVHEKMRQKEFGNMLLLARMKDQLESLMSRRRQRYLTLSGYESIVNKLHLDAEGHIVEPFVALTDKVEREKRAKDWYEMLALDLEEECLIK